MAQPSISPAQLWHSATRTRLLTAQNAAWLIIGFGAVLRIAQFLANRSLWLDEARLALNIVNRDFAGLLQPLEYNQAAPIGFLWAERLMVVLFGRGEYALRLLPLLASLVGLVLFWRLALRCTGPAVALMALAIFAVVEPPVVYASELKQYASDATITMALIMLVLSARSTPDMRLSWRYTLLLATAGGAAIWFSHPSLFVLAAIGLTMFTVYLLRRDWASMARISSAGVLWAISLGVTYIISLRVIRDNPRLQNYWGDAYMPLPPTSLADLRWFTSTFTDVFQNPGGFRGLSLWLAMALFVAGAVWLFRTRATVFWLLSLPALLAMLASGLHVYPFDGRLLLFLAPMLFLLVASGIAALTERLPRAGWVQLALVVLLIAQPLWLGTYRLARPRTKEELRPVVAYVQQQYAPGEAIYVYHGALAAYRYYALPDVLPPAQTISGSDPYLEQERYREDLAPLRGKRAWIVFSHVLTRNDVPDEQVILAMLDDMGQRLDTVKQPGASAYLYDMR